MYVLWVRLAMYLWHPEASHPLELKLETIVRYPTGVLGNQTRVLCKTRRSLNC